MIKINTNIRAVTSELRKSRTLHATAFARALTKTAFDVRDEERNEMTRIFDRPTPYTLNSLKVKPAKPNNLTATVWFRGTEQDSHYILPQVFGGNRMQTRFEYMLRRIGMLGDREVLVPASNSPAIRLDKYGNVSKGQYIQILSQLRAFYLAGSSQNETEALRSKREKKMYTIRYFFARKGESKFGRGSWKSGEKIQHLQSGIWARVKDIMGSNIYPVFLVAKRAHYRRRFRFYEIAERTINMRFPLQMNRQLLKEYRKNNLA